MSTTMVRKEDVVRKWYVLDAAGKPLGKTAALAADLLRGIRQGVEGGDDVDPAVCGARGGRAAGQGERAQDQRREYASQHDNHSQLK